MHVCVINLDNRLLHLYVDPQDTVAVLSNMISERTGVLPNHQRLVVFGSKTLREEKTLQDSGLCDGSVVHLLSRAVGGGCPNFEFASLRSGKENLFDDTAPEYRGIAPGFNLEGRCMNEDCTAFRQMVWSNMGFKHGAQGKTDKLVGFIGTLFRKLVWSSVCFKHASERKGGLVGFNIGAVIHTAPCPLCRTKLPSRSIVSCGFYMCEYKFEGYKNDSEEMTEGGKRVDKSDAFEYHDGMVDSAEWTHLVIEVKPL